MSKINHPIDLLGKFPVDAKNITFNTLEQALTTITNFKRYRGLIIKIKNGKWITRYWWESDDLSDSGISLLDKYPEITNEPTGFKSDVAVHNEDIDIEYNSTTKSIKITGSLVGYYKGKDIITIATGSEWISDPCPNVVGEKHYQLRYGDSGWEWVASNVFDYRKLNVAYLYFRSNGDFVFGLRSCDGLMQWQSKENFKKKFGTTLESGGDLTDYIKESTTTADRRPLISQTVVSDEDVNTINLAKANEIYTQAYISGANTTSNPDQTDIVPLVSGLPQYNLKTDEVYSLSELPNNKVMSVWVYSKPALKDNQSQKYRYVFQVGQWYSDDVIEEKARQTNELYQADLQAIIPRVVYIAQIIIKRLGANWSIVDVVKLSGSQNIQLSISGNYLSIVQTDGITITGTGTTSDPVKSNVFNADEAGANLPQRSRIQGGDFIEYTDDDVNSKTIVDIKPEKLEEATELESEVIELEQADELEAETFLNPDWEETDPTKISYIQNKPTISGSLWEPETFQKVGYGYLYNGYAVYESVKFNGFIEGFTVPTEAQLYELINIAGGDGNKLKSKRVDPNIHPRWDAGYVATDDFNLSLVPGGIRFDVSSGFIYIGEFAILYSSYRGEWEGNDESAWLYIDNTGEMFVTYESSLRGSSIRCIRQLTDEELLLQNGTFLQTVKDYDGNTYQVVKIGNYGWMAQNLATTHYADGTEIPNVTDQTEWDDADAAYCIYNNNPALPGLYYTDEVINQHIKPKDNKAVRSEHIEGLDNSKWQLKPIEIRSGYLYNWYALENIANTGWRVPTESDWDALALLIDPNYSKVFGENNYNSLIGRALSLNDRRFWKYMLAETEQAYNEAQFNAVGTGDRSDTTGLFNDKRALTRYHSSTIDGSNQISYYTIEVQGYSISESYDNDRFTFGKWDYRSRGMSVRLCRDIETWEEGNDVEMQQYIGNDGKRYKTIRIGNLVWLAENLCETLYNDLTPIFETTTASTWATLTEGRRCSYNNDETNSFINKEQIQPKNERLVNEYDIDKPIYEWIPFTSPTIIWECRKGYANFGFYKKIEASSSFTLNILRFQNGDTGTLRIHNTDSNPITITLSTGFTNKGSGSLINLPANSIHLFCWVFDGDIFIYNIQQYA